MMSPIKILVAALLLISCVSVKKSIIRKTDLFTIPNPESYSIIGSINVSNLYFDPFAGKHEFNRASEKTLNTIVPDALYDLDGDICWITDFSVNPHSLKCLGMCSELSFNIVVLKQK